MNSLPLDLLYPPDCLCCGTLLERRADCLCSACEDKLPRLPEMVCPRCGRPAEQCDCRRHPHTFDRSLACFWYEEGIWQAVHRLKYDNDRRAARFFGREMADRARTGYRDETFYGVVPVPMAPGRQLLRGYNQAERLARLVAEELGLPMLRRRLRRLSSRQQHALSAGERLRNAERGYCLLEHVPGLRGTVLLVDDVQTTGATLDRCAYLLRQLGAERVCCLVAAAAPLPQQELESSR